MINVKWERIFILYEFQQYLNKCSFMEISLVNRLLREKFKNRVFYGIKFHNSHLSQLQGYFDNEDLEEMYYQTGDLESIAVFKSAIIDPFLSELIKKIEFFSAYCKSIDSFDLGRAGYFIITSATIFNQLTQLKINECFINMQEFNQLMVKLDKLEYLDLKDIRLIKFPDEGTIERETLLPATLVELRLSALYLSITDLPNSAYNFLFNYNAGMQDEEEDEDEDDDDYELEEFYLPAQHLPHLKKLEIYLSIDNDDYIPEFLSFNQQLTYINLPLRNLTTKTITILSENNNIEQMKIDFDDLDRNFSTGISVPCLYTLNSLSIPLISKGEYSNVLQFIVICPNLTAIDVCVLDYDTEFISNVLRILSQLKAIKLKVLYLTNKELDFTIFSNIEILKIDIYNKSKVKYILPSPPMKLQLVKIYSKLKFKENFNLLKKSYKDDVYWSFKLLGNSICCRAINN